ANKRFELFHEGRELLAVTPVTTLRERAFQVFGSEIVEELAMLGPKTSSSFVLEGLISGPHVQKLNRNSVYLFVNGRLIRDKVLLHAITAAYYNLMPPGCYPFALLFLNCDPGEVDVNVHPSKTEVRFRQSSAIHDFVRDAVRELLMESRPVSSIPLPTSPTVLPRGAGFSPRGTLAPPQRAADLPYSEFTAVMMEQSVPQPEPPPAKLPEIHVPSIPSPKLPSRIPDTHGALDHLAENWDRVDTFAALPDLRPLGQIHESFIVAAGRDGLWIIDQHVAHERILFEQVLRRRAENRPEIQRLLMPLVLQLTPAQQFEYARIADELNAHGFETEPFGQRTIAIKAAPAEVGPAEIEKVIFEILDIGEAEFRAASLDEIRRSMCATIACRAAIKINTKLEPNKIDWLLRALARCEYPMTCPHGRPIALRYSTKDILKSFHRI
ncbi:MAG: DNA mismatch repair endonuclease MutL, partial [Candidatus Acidiferrales bacterium]